MEAATPLRPTRVHSLVGRLIVENLVVDDAVAAELVRERGDAGEDPARVVCDAIEIGARVLDREQAGATVEVLRRDLQRASRDVEAQLGQTSEAVVTELRTRLEEAFGAESGQVTRVLARHFGADSSTAVQHQVRAAVAELLGEYRERLFRQFSSADESNPLATFQRHAVAAIRQSSDQQHAHLRQMQGTIEELRLEVAKLQAEKVRREEVAAEHERSTAKGRPYEEAVFEAVDAIAHGQGDDCDAVGDTPGVGGRKGDVLVGIDGCSGPPRARIVFEAKNSQVARKRALAELDEAMAQRDAAYAVWVVPSEDKLPARTQPLREVNGDKLFVVYDPDEGPPAALELAYRLGRARALMARGDADGLDATALRAEVEKALGTMEEVRRVKQQLTHAANGIDAAREIVESLDRRVRAHLAQIDALLAPAAPDDDDDDS
jgi:TolA-binding protein